MNVFPVKLLVLPIKLLFLVGIVFITGFLVSIIFKNKSNISIMLLGISIILAGGILALDPGANLNGFGQLIALLGLTFVFAGFAKK